MSLTELMEIMPPPLSPNEVNSEAKWLEVEQECGIVFPRDYKAFIQTYGTGVIGRFLVVWNPFSDNSHVNLLSMIWETLDILKYLKNLYGDEYTHILYPEKCGLLPFADTPNGDILCWKTDGDPEQWTLVYLNDCGPKYEEHQLSLTEFLVANLKGELPNSIFSNENIFKREAGFMSIS